MNINKIDFEPILAEARKSEEGFANLVKTIDPYILSSAKTKLNFSEDVRDVSHHNCFELFNNLKRLCFQ